MRNPLCLLLCYAVGWLCAITLPCSRTCAQSADMPATDEEWHFRLDLFQLLLEEQGLTEQLDLDFALAQPRGSVIVVTGAVEKNMLPWNRLLRFIEDGGTLLLASDKDVSLPGIGRFYTGPVIGTDPSTRYRSFSDCVRVSEITNAEGMFKSVGTIVTNRSTWFLPETRGAFQWQTVAQFPRECLPEASRGKPLLALGRPVSGGRGLIVVSADASLLTNGMLWHGDNAVLAIRLASLLSRGDKRQLVFIADGQILGNARDRLPPPPSSSNPNRPPQAKPPEPQLSQMLKLVNAVVKEVVDSNVINETLKQQPRNVRAWRYFQLLLVVLTALFFAWALIKLLTSGTLRPILLRRRRMRSAYELQATVGGDQAGDYRQSAGYLAREFCRQLTGSPSSADWQKYAASLSASTSALPGADQRELIRIVDMASRGCRVRMSSADLQQLGKTLAVLRIKTGNVAHA